MVTLTKDVPNPDEFEISLIGRGYGESICIHINGRWFVVDSLTDSSGRCVPLDYLTGMGVDVARDVALIVATHWHDDHIKGISELYRDCKGADLVFAAAMLEDEFKQYFSRHAAENHGRLSSGMAELRAAGEIRRAENRNPPHLAVANKVLFRDEVASADIEALAPSNGDVEDFLSAVGDRLNRPSTFVERAMPFDRNNVSVVLAVTVGDDVAILGADLENGAKDTAGWTAILDSKVRRQTRGDYFKTPHHGSKNAHNDRVWTEMLNDQPIVTLTPWNRGTKLPRRADVERLVASSDRCYITNSRADIAASTQIAAVDNTIAESKIRVRRQPTEVGQIRARKRPGEDWKIDLSGDAVRLDQFRRK